MLVSRSGVILLTIQFAVLAGYAVVLVAGMLVERRRSEIALMRSRGASGMHLVAMALIEVAFLAVPAAALAPVLALGVVAPARDRRADCRSRADRAPRRSARTRSSWQPSAGVACMLALTLPTLFVSASPAGARAATGRQARTTLAQRLGLDLALVAVAAVALWQLRLYGAPLTRNVRGTLGLDPLLVAAPAIGLVGGAVLALRVVPRIAELAEQFLVRGRGLVGSLGGRQLARRPLRYTRSALLLMLAAALGTLAAAHAATWTPVAGRPGGVSGCRGRPGHRVDVLGAPDVGGRPDVPGDPRGSSTSRRSASPRSTSGGRSATRPSPASIRRDGRSSAGRRVTSGARTGTPARPRPSPRSSPRANPPPTIVLPGRPPGSPWTVDVAFRAVVDPFGSGTGRGGTTIGLEPGLAGLLRGARHPRRRRPALPHAGDRRLADRCRSAAHLRPGRSGGRRAPPGGPLAVEAIELLIAPTDQVVIVGTAEVVGLEATDRPTGEAGWTPVAVDGGADGWSWDRSEAASASRSHRPQRRPNRVSVGSGQPIFGGFGSGAAFRLARRASATGPAIRSCR